MSAVLAHHVSFTGTVRYGEVGPRSGRTLVVDDTGLLDARLLGLLRPAEVVRLDARPDDATVERLARTAVDGAAEALVAFGSGALVDAVKLVWQRVERESQCELDVAFVPCGPEPYRAVARFAVVDDAEGQRPTVVDGRFASAEVWIVPTLLAQLPDPVVATHALDSAVHAVESLLSSLASPFSRLLAATALRTIVREPRAERPQLLTSAFLAAEAFASTRLGVAHAIASPLGTTLGITHDTINAVLGEAVVEFWGSEVEGFGEVAEACAAGPTTLDVRDALARLRVEAELPGSLSELGISWASVEQILPRAARSSGIAALPSQLSTSELEAFARRAWRGRIDEEVADARPA